MTGAAVIVQGDALHLPLQDASVDLIVTSPPYWALRAYGITCRMCEDVIASGGDPRTAYVPSWDDHVARFHREIGSEPTPQAYLEALWAATAEMMRVLKPTGSAFIDLGDKYAGNTGNMPAHNGPAVAGRSLQQVLGRQPGRSERVGGHIRDKSLMLLPERYRVGCVDQTSDYYRAQFYQQLADDLMDGDVTPERARQLADEFEASPKSKGLGLIARAVIVWCLSGGARVYARTPTGDRPMMLRDLARAYQPENVQLWNGHQWTQVLGWNRTPDDDGALELEFRSGERVGCTPGHQWPTTEGLKRADELRVGDVVLQTALPEPERPRNPAGLTSDDLSEDVGWLVGLYIAEGSRSGTTIQIAGHLRETERYERLARIARDYDGTCHVYQTSENGSTCNLHGPVLAGIIDQYVSQGTAKTKRLRKAAWQRDTQFLTAVVKGYLHGDGHYDAKNDRWRIGFTANDEWAADLRTLAARLGARVRLKRRTTSFNGQAFPGWGGEWRWKRPIRSKPDTEIVAIRRSRARDFYDLGVADEPHLFALASGVLTHNSKPNGLPESVTDRPHRSHEDWVMLVKQPRYYSATDEIRESYLHPNHGQIGTARPRGNGPSLPPRGPSDLEPHVRDINPLGKLPSSVWTIPSEPLRLPDHLGVQHYAAFPSEWPRRLILGWSPPGICVECETGRVPVVERRLEVRNRNVAPQRYADDPNGQTPGDYYANTEYQGSTTATILGYACSCTPFTDHPERRQPSMTPRTSGSLQVEVPATGQQHAWPERQPIREYHLDRWTPPPTRPAVILDPFGGTGTTAMVARALGRIGISVDLSHAYGKAARWRVRHDAAKAISRTWKERQGELL